MAHEENEKDVRYAHYLINPDVIRDRHLVVVPGEIVTQDGPVPVSFLAMTNSQGNIALMAVLLNPFEQAPHPLNKHIRIAGMTSMDPEASDGN